jgi:tellurite methyltransferase
MSQGDREKWDARWAERARAGIAEPAPFLDTIAHLLPARGRALDVAGGNGRNALWLAGRGLEVTVCDVSPVGLEQARAAGLATLLTDLDTEPLPAGPWDVLLIHHFLLRRLFSRIPGVLLPGGVVVYIHPTRRNLERHPHPQAAFLVAEGELAMAVGRLADLDLLHYEEGWFAEGRHEARLVARRRR